MYARQFFGNDDSEDVSEVIRNSTRQQPRPPPPPQYHSTRLTSSSQSNQRTSTNNVNSNHSNNHSLPLSPLPPRMSPAGADNWTNDADFHEISRSLLQPSEHQVLLSQTVSLFNRHIVSQEKYNNDMFTYCQQVSSYNLNTLNKKFQQFIERETKARETIKMLCMNEMAKASNLNKSIMNTLQPEQRKFHDDIKEIKEYQIIMNEKNEINSARINKEIHAIHTVDLKELSNLFTTSLNNIQIKQNQNMEKLKKSDKEKSDLIHLLNEQISVLQHNDTERKKEVKSLKASITKFEDRLNEMQRGGYDW
jgi:hypothetical protein